MASPYGWRNADTTTSRFDSFFFFCGYNTEVGNGKGNTSCFIGLPVMGED